MTAAHACKEFFGVVDFGINPNAGLPADGQIATWVPAGTVIVGIGENVRAGGDDKTPDGYFLSLPGTNVPLRRRSCRRA